MNFTLVRRQFIRTGIFGELFLEGAAKAMFATLEHAFPAGDGYRPILTQGVYTCVRGIHRLSDLKPFETFEVMNVPGHTGILFHVGNSNKDSSGCILLGNYQYDNVMVCESKNAFGSFMQKQSGLDSFILTVEN